MVRQSRQRTRAGRTAPTKGERRKVRGPGAAELGAATSRVDFRGLTADEIQRLHPLLGNRGVQDAIHGRRLLTVARFTVFPSLLQRDDGEEGDEEAEKEAPKEPAETMIDKERSVEVLQDAYGTYVKKIKGGKVNVLEQAEFQAAYDKIYGKTKYAWDKYIVPKFGNLEGFAYKNVNYINKDLGSVDVVPHEMLHNNDSPKWTPFAGSELNEGTTEYLTIKAVTAAKYTASHSYPDQEGVVQELVKMTSEELLMSAYFKGKTGDLKKEMQSKCKGTWARFKKAMQAQDWAKAKAHLEPKEAAKPEAK